MYAHMCMRTRCARKHEQLCVVDTVHNYEWLGDSSKLCFVLWGLILVCYLGFGRCTMPWIIQPTAQEPRNRFQTSRLGNYTSSDLRELWGIPLLWIQTYLIWRLLLAQGTRRWLLLNLVLVTFAFIVSWQFSPFLLLLQATALYFVNIVLGFDSIRPVFVDILNAYILAMGLAVAVHFGSPYLLTSPFFFQLVALKTATSMFGCHGRSYTWSSWICRRAAHVMEGLVAVVVFLLVRKVLAPFATADTHVYEILCTKVAAINDVLPTSWHLPASRLPSCAEPSFNANLYLIMGVFKLLEWSSAKVYLESTAAPAAALTCILVFIRCFFNCLESRRPKKSVQPNGAPAPSSKGTAPGQGGLRHRRPEETSEQTLQEREIVEDVKLYSQEGEDAALLFFVMQSLLFLILGCLVNRLRVAFGPPMMVLAAALWGTKLFASSWRSRFPAVLLAVLLLGFSGHVLWMIHLFPCLNDQEGICQHTADKISNDGDLADLYDWFNNEDLRSSPVLASMNLAGSMRAFTDVPMIIHPQSVDAFSKSLFFFKRLLYRVAPFCAISWFWYLENLFDSTNCGLWMALMGTVDTGRPWANNIPVVKHTVVAEVSKIGNP